MKSASRFRDNDVIEDEIRMKALNRRIEDQFGELAADEVEEMAKGYDDAFSQMVEVIKLGKKKCTFEVMGRPSLGSFPVVVPLQILEYLKKYDVFFAVLGQRENAWQILYLSPHYLSGADIERWAREHQLQ